MSDARDCHLSRKIANAMILDADVVIREALRSLVRARSLVDNSDDDELRASITRAKAGIEKALDLIGKADDDIEQIENAEEHVTRDPQPSVCSYVYVISFDPDAEPQTGTCAIIPEDSAR